MINIHIYPSALTHESRILRITDALMSLGIFDRIEIVGVGKAGLPETEQIDKVRQLIRLPRRSFPNSYGFFPKLIKTFEWSLRVLFSLRGKQIACINAHSLAVLPLSVVASFFTGAKLVYDTHELETETSECKGIRGQLARVVERIFIRRCDKVFVVSESIGQWYADAYKIPHPIVIRNIPQFKAVDSESNRLRRTMQISEDNIVFIYQGGFIEGRGVERLLRIFADLPDKHLLCMGSGPLDTLVVDAALNHSNIHHIPPVAPSEVLGYSCAADVGICLTDNTCLSHYYSMPNKIFEYLHAGLPIIINPLFEQQRIVETYVCGWIAPEEDRACAEMLRSITREDIAKRLSGVALARKEFCWVKERTRLENAYRDWLNA